MVCLFLLVRRSKGINAVDPGHAALVPEKDLAGKDRISHGAADLGALEFCQATMDLSGTYSDDMYWIADTVRLTGDVVADGRQTIYIAHGTYIEVASRKSLTYNGVLVARGLPGKKIIFDVSDQMNG